MTDRGGGNATGPVAVITGAASGIGAACAERFRQDGWRIAAIDLRDSDADLAVTADVRDRAAVTAAVDEAAARFGRIDLAVTAAGYYEEGIDVAEISHDQWDRMLAVILGGTVNTFAAVLPHMLARGAGSIVAISSELALRLAQLRTLRRTIAGPGPRWHWSPGRRRGSAGSPRCGWLPRDSRSPSTTSPPAKGSPASRPRSAGLAVPADISAPYAAPTIVQAVTDALGPVDVLVANAAAMAMSPFLDADPGQWWRQIDVNLTGHFRLIQAVLPGMRAAGHGRIVIITSGWGVIGHPNATAYAASKAGLIALTKGLGRELGPQGILTNAIAPSFIDTEQLRVDADDAGITLEEIRQRYREEIPVRRLAIPEDIAGAVAFLAGPGGSALIGQILQPNGGVTRTRA